MRSLILLVAVTSSARADVVAGAVRGADLTGVQVDVYDRGDRIRSMMVAEDGRYAFDVPAGTYDVIAFSDTLTSELRTIVVAGDAELDPLALARHAPFVVRGTAPIIQPARRPVVVRTIRELGRLPTSRDRTHRAWIAPASPADPARAVTTVDGGQRFSTAPGIPIAFLDQVTTMTFSIEIDQGAGSGAAAKVVLAAGDNDPTGVARLVLGLDRDAPVVGIEALAKQPFASKRAWVIGGIATDHRGDPTGLAALRYKRDAHGADLVALASAEDVWGYAAWTATKDKLRVTASLTGERLVPTTTAVARAAMEPSPEVATRVGPNLTVRRTGEHTLVAALGAGIGRRGDSGHGDVSYAVGDEWRLSRSFRLDAGLRGEYRRTGDTSAHVALPRAVIIHDRPGEKLSALFFGFHRVSRLDDGLPGAWRAQPVLFHDELVGGVAFFHDDVHMGFAGRVRRNGEVEALGGDAWLRYEGKRTTVYAMASSLQRTANFMGLHTFHRTSRNALRAALTARIDATGTEAGTALAWMRFRGERTLDLQLEGYEGTRGPGMRLLAGASW